MNREIRLTYQAKDCTAPQLWGGEFFWSRKPRSGRFAARYGVCERILLEEIILPENTKTIFAVFTKKPRVDSFEIEPRGRGAAIVNVTQGFAEGTDSYLLKRLEDGYKYVHIEY